MTDTLTDRLPPHALDALAWRCLGPWRGGRVMAVCGHPTRPDTCYAGASGGGVWRTDNGGATWRPLSDGAFRRGSVGAVALAPSEPDTLYVGTGECGMRSNVTGGDGVYASRDGGETWRHCGLTETQNIARVVVHPRDAETVYVAAFGHRFGPNAERGVYRTRDGGASWERVLHRDERSGAIDLAMDPQNPRVLYAALWEAGRTPWGFTSGGPGSGVFRSEDGGDSWQEITRNPGLPTGVIGRVGLCVSPADPRRVYALIEAQDDGGRKVSGVYRSLDRGRTWAWTSDEPNLQVRPWYFGQIVADPLDADTVYVPHRKLWKSTDGGRTLRQLNTTYWDQHALWVADDPRRMIVANDGGASVSRDGGATWSTVFNQPTAEMYRVTTDTRFPYRVYSAQQDNSTVSIPHRAFTGPPSQMHWYDVVGGESGHIAVRPDNPDIVYAASFAGEVTRYDHATGDQHTISVWPEPSDGWGADAVRHRFNWTTPVYLSPHDPDVLYVCGERVFRSTDEGQTYDAISPDLSRNDRAKMGRAGGPITYDSAGTDYYGTIQAFAESPLQQGVLWAGTDDGLLHVSRDNSATWANVTPPGLPEWANVNTVEPSPWDAGGAYVAVSNQKQDDMRPYLFRTHDYGQTWTAITSGIPADEFCRTVRCDPARRGLLYAGSEGGVWLSLDDGAAWRPFRQNLPAVTVYDLAVKNGDLIAATHGRSLWILDDLTPLHTLAADTLAAPAHLFPPRPTVRVTRAVFGISSLIALAYPHAADNPPAGVMLHYWLPDDLPTGDLTLTISDGDGEPIERYTSESEPDFALPLGPYKSYLRGSTAVLTDRGPGEEEGGVRVGVLPPEMQEAPQDSGRLTTRPGLNRFVWDMLYPGAADLFGESGPGLTTPIALPGLYSAALQVGDETYTTTFEIAHDPRMKATGPDLQAQFDLIIKVRDSVTLSHETIHAAVSARIRVNGARRAFVEQGDTQGTEVSKALIASIRAVEETLRNPALHNRAGEQEDLNSPYGLSEKMGKFGYWVAKADVAPTRQMYGVYNSLAAGIRAQVARLHEIVAGDLAALNAQLAAVGLPLRTIGCWYCGDNGLKILVVKLADIGDAIGTLPALRALRAAYPEAVIDALVTPGGAREVLAHEPAVSGVRVLAKGAFDSLRGAANPRALAALARFGAGLRGERYDAVVFLHHLTTAAGAAKYRALALAAGAPIRVGLDNGRGDWLTHRAADHGFGAMPEWAYWLSVVAALGVAPPADPRPTLAPPAAAIERARALVPDDAPFVALHPGVGAFAPARQWPPARLAAVGKGLHAEGYALVVTGGPDDGARAASAALREALGDTPALDLTGRADILATAAVYARAALWVGSDGGAAHLAAAVGAPGTVVFGPSNAAAWSPYGAAEWHPGDDLAALPPGARTVVVRDPVPCSPCFYTGFTLGRPGGCPSRACLAGVGAGDVLAVGRVLLHRRL